MLISEASSRIAKLIANEYNFIMLNIKIQHLLFANLIHKSSVEFIHSNQQTGTTAV